MNVDVDEGVDVDVDEDEGVDADELAEVEGTDVDVGAVDRTKFDQRLNDVMGAVLRSRRYPPSC